jgi:hypothetical protein
MLRRRYTYFCAAVLGLFAWTELRGIELGPSSAEHATIPTASRGAEGYRSYHFFRGGK